MYVYSGLPSIQDQIMYQRLCPWGRLIPPPHIHTTEISIGRVIQQQIHIWICQKPLCLVLCFSNPCSSTVGPSEKYQHARLPFISISKFLAYYIINYQILHLSREVVDPKIAPTFTSQADLSYLQLTHPSILF